jgi:hypothetical protein
MSAFVSTLRVARTNTQLSQRSVHGSESVEPEHRYAGTGRALEGLESLGCVPFCELSNGHDRLALAQMRLLRSGGATQVPTNLRARELQGQDVTVR